MPTTYISVPFTAANGTAWATPTVGLLLASGSPDNGTVQGNVGQPGAGTGARVYTARGLPGVSAYSASVTCTWATPATTSVCPRLALRVAQGDASGGYFVDVDSNSGAPRLRVQRRVAGVDTDVLAWQALATITSANLAAGVVVYAAIENKPSAVRIIVRVGGVDQADVDDTNAARINDGGTVGLGVPVLAVGTEVLYDALLVQDLAQEQTTWYSPGGAVVPGLREVDVTGDMVVTLQGRYADRTWLSAQSIDVCMARASWDLQPSVRIRDRNPFHKPLLAHGTHVTVRVNGTVVASGRMRGVEQQAYPPEGSEYEVACPKELAQDVLVLDPRSGTNVVTWNVDEENSQYDPERQGKSIADVITWLVTYCGDELRSVGAAPASGDILAAGALAGFTATIPNLTLSGDVARCIESLLRYAPKRGWLIDPATLKWSFPDRSAAAKRNINIGSQHVLGSLGTSPKANYTRILVTGQAAPATTTLRLSAGDIAEGWDTGLNASYTRSKSWRGQDNFTITGSGVDVPTGLVYVDVDGTLSDVTANEWRDSGLVINAPSPAAGEYRVRSNTGGLTPRFLLNRTTWVGAAPLVGDTGYAGGGTRGAKGNGYNEAFRAYDLTGSLAGSPAANCYEARIINLDPTGTGTQVSKTRAQVQRVQDQSTYPPTYKTRVVLDTPAVKPAGDTPATEDACEGGGTTQAADVEIDFPVATLDTDTDEGVATAPTLLVPGSGYRGTAYSRNSTLWNGGGEPGLGDMGCRRTLVINDPQYDGSAARIADYTTLANDMLAVLGTLARTGSFRIAGLLNVWANIAQRVTLSDSGGRATGYETADDLWVIGVEWDFETVATTVYVGTLVGAGGYDIQAVRDEFASRIRVDSQRRDLGEVMRLQDCLRNNLAGGYVGAPDPTPLPDCQVTTVDSRGNPTTGKDARLEAADCTPTGAAVPGCSDFPCGTSAPGVFIANAAAVAKKIHHERTAAIAAVPAGDKGMLEAVCCAMEHISALWVSLLSGFSAVDHELHKTFQNLGTIRGQTVAMKDVINANFTLLAQAVTCLDDKIEAVCAGLRMNDNALAMAISQRMMGASPMPALPYDCDPMPSCDVMPQGCVWNFTETVCDPVDCAWQPPAVPC